MIKLQGRPLLQLWKQSELDREPVLSDAETSHTHHHDTLVKAVLKITAELKDREEVKDPGWFVDAADTLHPLVASRSAAVTQLVAAPRSRTLRRKLPQ